MTSQVPNESVQKGKNGAFSGYQNRLFPSPVSPLTQVGPGTAGGEYLRRYWHPVVIASEVDELPKAIRILGEDLVIFRDKSGNLGLLHKNCIHRGASLEFGIPQERGIMCCYHGWHFGTDGEVLGVGAEPGTSRIPVNFSQGAYPVREACGLIFAYMGPPDKMPEFPYYDTFSHPDDNILYPIKMTMPCNWLKVVENACDPIHNAYLHAIVAGEQFSSAFKVLPALDFVETPLGFLSMATRKVNDKVYIRASDIILPNVAQFASGNNDASAECFNISCGLTRWVVPVDDDNCFYTGLMHYSERTAAYRRADPSELGVGKMGFIGQTDDRPYEERQMEPGDYDAVVSIGNVFSHRAEHLGTTDRGIVMFRRMLGRAIDSVSRDEVPELPKVYESGPVRTYNHEVVLSLPSQSNITDMQSLANFGRRAAQIIIDSDSLPPYEREAQSEKKIRQLLVNDLIV